MRNAPRVFASGGMTAALLAAAAALAAFGSFLPGARGRLLFGSTPFAALLGLLSANLLLGVLLSLRRPAGARGLNVIRLGAVLVLAGGFLGRGWGVRGRAQLYEGDRAEAFETAVGGTLRPGFALRLDRFSVARYPGGRMELGISAGSPGGPRPYPVEIGRWTGPEEMRVLPLRYLPDFLINASGAVESRTEDPNNPALEVEVRAGGETERGWLLARFPAFPPVGLSRTLRAGRLVFLDRQAERVKSYRSDVTILEGGERTGSGTVEVNRPLRHGGYRIYQTGYDPVGWQWSELEVVRDPGLPLVYGGFALLALGCTLWLCCGEFNRREGA